METPLRADCSRCAGLCCVALAYDRSTAFPFDKPAGVRCRHLESDYTCSIHSELSARGFSGCVHFDCLGAGQKVTALFDGRPWRDEETLKPAVIDTFRRMRRIHELMSLVAEAGRLPLGQGQEQQRTALLNALEGVANRPLETLEAFDRSTLPGEVRRFLEGLRDAALEYASQSRDGTRAVPRTAGRAHT
ncbi:hypothetical protein [Pelagibacterium xiamenense]|uniref:hypothetical protein n=1 Tax=Pelagibacterium xiamenense TaxID=2901140 RepID=UPI001E2BD6BB|nr:hypothetical protein [Pelagibacterium xiamenense]MCD7061475.1 hypothetical protein [Pelagibacterium xiamenense]